MDRDEPTIRLRVPFGDEWYTHVLLLHRRLGDPQAHLPTVRDTSMFDAIPSAFAGLYAGAALLGWTDVGRGFRQLVTGSHDPVPEAIHSIVADWLGPSGCLEALAYWCDSRAFGLGPGGQPVHTFSHRKTPLSDEAARRLWLFDDQDGMHLTGHIDAISYPLVTGRPAEMSEQRTDASRHRVIRDDRHRSAALFVDRFEAWPAALHRLSLELAGDQPPWSVDVISTADGWLGRWRRCWDCGRWFIGYAGIHILGHRV